MLIGCWIESAELKILGHDRTGVLWCVVMFDDVLFYHCSSRGRLCEEQRPRRNSMPWTVCPIVELNPRTETDSESKNYQQVVFFAYILYIYIILYSICIYYNIAPVSWCESGLPWGVKGLILQGFASLCMSWCGYEMVMLHFKQNISNHSVYNLTRNVLSSMILMPGMNSALYCCIYIYIYTIYIYTHHWYFLFFSH